MTRICGLPAFLGLDDATVADLGISWFWQELLVPDTHCVWPSFHTPIMPSGMVSAAPRARLVETRSVWLRFFVRRSSWDAVEYELLGVIGVACIDDGDPMALRISSLGEVAIASSSVLMHPTFEVGVSWAAGGTALRIVPSGICAGWVRLRNILLGWRFAEDVGLNTRLGMREIAGFGESVPRLLKIDKLRRARLGFADLVLESLLLL